VGLRSVRTPVEGPSLLRGLERQLLLLNWAGLRRVLRHSQRVRQDCCAVFAVGHAEPIGVRPDDVANWTHRLNREVVAITLALASWSWSVTHAPIESDCDCGNGPTRRVAIVEIARGTGPVGGCHAVVRPPAGRPGRRRGGSARPVPAPRATGPSGPRVVRGSPSWSGRRGDRDGDLGRLVGDRDSPGGDRDDPCGPAVTSPTAAARCTAGRRAVEVPLWAPVAAAAGVLPCTTITTSATAVRTPRRARPIGRTGMGNRSRTLIRFAAA